MQHQCTYTLSKRDENYTVEDGSLFKVNEKHIQDVQSVYQAV
jgi:hypothetical protein